jgi:hypothetical protein
MNVRLKINDELSRW